MPDIPHEFKLVLTYRGFLDYVNQCVDMYKECPRPTKVEMHVEEMFSDWMDMARNYKTTGEIIQFVSDTEEWDSWLEYCDTIIADSLLGDSDGQGD